MLPLPSSLITRRVFFLSLASFASLVSCRPTEGGDSFSLIEAEHPLPESVSFQDIYIPTYYNFGGPSTSTSTYVDSVESTVINHLVPPLSLSDTVSESSSFWTETATAAIDSICPGRNRFAYCCDAFGCNPSLTCDNGAMLQCCTREEGDLPEGSSSYSDCGEAYTPPNSGFENFPGETEVSSGGVSNEFLPQLL